MSAKNLLHSWIEQETKLYAKFESKEQCQSSLIASAEAGFLLVFDVLYTREGMNGEIGHIQHH